jgi:hypothetical protein
MPRRNLFRRDSWEYGHDTAADEQPLPEPRKRRTATTVVYAALFFAGATFTAVAGDKFAQMNATEDATSAAADATGTDTTTTDATTTSADDATPARAESSSDSAPATAPARATAPADSSAPASAPAPTRAGNDSSLSAPAPAAPQGNGGSSSASGPQSAPAPKSGRAAHKAPKVILLPKTKPMPAPEIEGPESAATIWLNRPLPDPTPPALRLSPTFARNLKAISKASGVDWSLLLAVLRAKGLHGHNPADKGTLRKLAARLASLSKGTAGGKWATAFAYDGHTAFADKTVALARYNRAVGLAALVRGLEATKRSLEDRLLNDMMINIYPGGRDDIAKDKVDVRVLATIAYLREAFGQVTVSCLISGHRLYARPGVISAHIFGRAVDIAGLGETSITGHQQPGGITEQAVRDILLLPGELMPRQVISLLGLGGPSFPMANHYDHIHIGW